jgi:hypothetical protein
VNRKKDGWGRAWWSSGAGLGGLLGQVAYLQCTIAILHYRPTQPPHCIGNACTRSGRSSERTCLFPRIFPVPHNSNRRENSSRGGRKVGNPRASSLEAARLPNPRRQNHAPKLPSLLRSLLRDAGKRGRRIVHGVINSIGLALVWLPIHCIGREVREPGGIAPRQKSSFADRIQPHCRSM